jgi:hypothetical protein
VIAASTANAVIIVVHTHTSDRAPLPLSTKWMPEPELRDDDGPIEYSGIRVHELRRILSTSYAHRHQGIAAKLATALDKRRVAMCRRAALPRSVRTTL